MTGDHRPSGLRFVEYFVTRASRPKAWVVQKHFLGQLSPADYVSLLGLLTAWSGVLAMLGGDLAIGILLTFGAFGFDKLDGYVARQTGSASEFGRQIDSFIDVFAYLVPAALVVHYGFSPHPVVSAVVGFLVIGFGGLRLVRHNDEGFQTEEGVSYYRGTTVVHTAVLVIVNFVALEALPLWNGWLAAASVAIACPFMLSDYRCYKTAGAHWLAGLFVVILSGLVLVVTHPP